MLFLFESLDFSVRIALDVSSKVRLGSVFFHSINPKKGKQAPEPKWTASGETLSPSGSTLKVISEIERKNDKKITQMEHIMRKLKINKRLRNV